jgi:hypothetical protein
MTLQKEQPEKTPMDHSMLSQQMMLLLCFTNRRRTVSQIAYSNGRLQQEQDLNWPADHRKKRRVYQYNPARVANKGSVSHELRDSRLKSDVVCKMGQELAGKKFAGSNLFK